MPTLSGLQMKTWTDSDSLALKLLSNFFELYSKRSELHNYARHETPGRLRLYYSHRTSY